MKVRFASIYGFALLASFIGTSYQSFAQGWTSPATFTDAESKWSKESNAIDGDTSTYASDKSNRVGYGGWLYVGFNSPVKTGRVRLLADFGFDIVDKVDVDRKVGGIWLDAYEGAIENVTFSELTFDPGEVEEFRFRFHYLKKGYHFWLFEFQVFVESDGVEVPVAETNSATSVEENSAVLHGLVSSDGGAPCQYRLEWGLTAEYGNTTPWTGSLTTGETFKGQIEGLAVGQAYHFRAQIRNSAGIGSGEDRVFVTAPAGTQWISPSGSDGSDSQWTNQSAAHDDELSTFTRAYHDIGSPQWSPFLHLTHLPIVVDKFRFNAKKSINIDLIDVDVRYEGASGWTDVYEGSFGDRVWEEKVITKGWVAEARVRFHIVKRNIGEFFELHEFDFHSVTNRWIHAAGDFKWNNAANWSLGHVPAVGEAIVFDSSSQATCEANANTVAANLHSLTLSQNYIGRLIFSAEFGEGYTQVLSASENVTINGGTWILTGKVVNTVVGTGVTINAGSFSVGSGGIVHSDGRGFGPQYGPGASDTFSYGPSHGGRGEDNLTNLEYGDPNNPITLGSGGSKSTSAAYDPGGQSGGGAILVNVGSGDATVNGTIRCNGDDDGFHNSGSGGSVYIQCGTFTGNGLLQARGGNINNAGRSPGGGGRIAVDYNNSTFGGSFDVSGGSDPQVKAQPGTVSLPAGADLVAKAGSKIGLAPGAHTFNSVTVENGAELFCHSTFDENNSPTGCEINAQSIDLQTGGLISAEGDGHPPEPGLGSHVDGGSHGGRGAGNLPAHGNALEPTSLGGGGRKSSWPGSGSRSPRWGGGAIKISAPNAIINGTLQANGESTTSGGGGAGGSIWLDVGTLSGAGSIQAEGGSGNGGGGRVAAIYAVNAFTGTVSVIGHGTGEAGSVVPGGLTISDHSAGQVSNAFGNVGSINDAVLYRFALMPSGNTDDAAFENIEISKLVFSVDYNGGVNASDFSNIKFNGSTNIPTSNSSVNMGAGSGTITLEFASGSFVLDGSDNEFELIGDVANLSLGDSLRISLAGVESNITAVGNSSQKPLSENNQNGFAFLSGNAGSAVHSLPSSQISYYALSSTSPQNQGKGWSEIIEARNAAHQLVDVLVEVNLSGTGSVKFYTDSSFTTETTTAILQNGTGTVFLKDDVAETITYSATDSLSRTGSSNPIVVDFTPVDHYEILSSSPQTAGVGFIATVRAKTAGGAVVGVNNTVTLGNSGNAVFYSDSTYSSPITQTTLSNGTATIYIKDTVAETIQVTATDSIGKTGTSANIVVQSAAVDHYQITATSPRIKGQGFTETVTAVDAFNNAVLTAAGTLNLSSTGNAVFYTDGSYATPASTASLVNGTATLYVKDDVLETITLNVTDGGGKSGISGPINITLSIQQRIDLASSGDTIVIEPGEYHETFVVNKPLTITTADPSGPFKPIIDGDGAPTVATIAASDVIIEGLELRGSSGDLIHCEGQFIGGGQVHPDTYQRLIVRHCRLHDAGGDGIQLRNVNDATVSNCLVWDVDGNGIFMDGVGKAVVKHNEVKGAGDQSNGIRIWWCFPATVENNFIHELYESEAGLYFANNWSGDHSIRNNVIANNKLKDKVSWHPFGGSALTVRKPTQDGTVAVVTVEHNTVVNNTGEGPVGVTGHGIAWDWNGAPNLTMNIVNNLVSDNSGHSFATRQDSINYGNIPSGGIFDWNDSTESILHQLSGFSIGNNNIGSQPIFTDDPDAYGKFRFALGECLARSGASDGRDMGAILNDPTGPMHENLIVKVRLGGSLNQADNLVDVGSSLASAVEIEPVNPWGIFPSQVRVYLSSTSTGSGDVEIRNAVDGSTINFVDVILNESGIGSTAFDVKGLVASSSDNDVVVSAKLEESASSVASDSLTVLAPGSYSLTNVTFAVQFPDGQPAGPETFAEVSGLGIVPNGSSLQLRSGTSISYRVLAGNGLFRIAGDAIAVVVPASDTTLVGTVASIELHAEDQDGNHLPGSFVAVEDSHGGRSEFQIAESILMIPVPGSYRALGKTGLIESSGEGVPLETLNVSSTSIVAPFRRLAVVANDQNGVAYPDVHLQVGRGPVLVEGPSGLGISLPLGSVVELTPTRFELSGQAQELNVEAGTTELTALLQSFEIHVLDSTTNTHVPDGAWKLLISGFEKSFGKAGTVSNGGEILALPLASRPTLEGFLWNASSKVLPTISTSTNSIEIPIDSSSAKALEITSNAYSTFSPAFIEGTRHSSADSITIETVGISGLAQQANLLGNENWFGYLPLSSSGLVTFRVTATNKYGQSATAELPNVDWVGLVAGTSSDQIIPIDTSVLIGMDASSVPGAVSLEVVPGDGRPALPAIGLGQFAEVQYTTPGIFDAEVRVLNANGAPIPGETQTIEITVVQVLGLEPRNAAGLEYERPVWFDVFPASVRSDVLITAVDNSLLQVTDQRNDPDSDNYPNRQWVNIRVYKPTGPLESGIDGGRAHFEDLTNDQKFQLLSSSVPAMEFRVGGEPGWIPMGLDNNVDEFTLFTDGQTMIVQYLQLDGSYQGSLNVTMVPWIADLDLSITAMGGSDLRFKSGTGKLSFSSNDMNEFGDYGAEFTKQFFSSNFCHSVTVQQNPIIFHTSLVNNNSTLTLGGGVFVVSECNDERGEAVKNGQKQNPQIWLPKKRWFTLQTSFENANIGWYLELKDTQLCPKDPVDQICGTGDIPAGLTNAGDPCPTGYDPAYEQDCEKLRFNDPKKPCNTIWPNNANVSFENCKKADGKCYDGDPKTAATESIPSNTVNTGIIPGEFNVDVYSCVKGEKAKKKNTSKEFFKVLRVEADGLTNENSTRDEFPKFVCVPTERFVENGVKEICGTPIQISARGPDNTTVSVRVLARDANGEQSRKVGVSDEACIRFPSGLSVGDEEFFELVFSGCLEFDLTIKENCFVSKTIYLYGLEKSANPDDVIIEVQALETRTRCDGGKVEIDPYDNWVVSDLEKTTVLGLSIDYLPTGEITQGDLTHDNPERFDGGYRYFPGARGVGNINEHRNYVGVRVIVEPAVENFTLFVRSFDVDDPSEDSEIDANGNSAEDNRGRLKDEGGEKLVSPKDSAEMFFGFQGRLKKPEDTEFEEENAVLELKTDSNGKADFVMAVTYSPGDNYRVLASSSKPALENLNPVTGVPRSGSVPGFEGCATEQLTIWRRVHVEQDKMLKPNDEDGDRQTGNITGSNQNLIKITVETDIDGVKKDEYAGGLLRAQLDGQEQNFKILENTAGDDVDFIVVGTEPIPNGSVTVYQDDYVENEGEQDEGGGAPTLRTDPQDDSHLYDFMQESTDVNKNRFADAYIVPEYQTLDAFDSNNVTAKAHTNDGLAETDAFRGSKNKESKYFWVVYVSTGFEQKSEKDNDPKTESAAGGTAYSKEVCLIFLETIKDTFAEGKGGLNYPSSENIMKGLVTAHEVGHQLGLVVGGDGHRNDGSNLMNKSVLAEGNSFIHNEDINELRKIVKSPGQ